MSSSGPRREVAYRVFASEFDDASYTYAESDEERAPNYVVTPTGARVNRLFVVGVLTEVEQVSDDVVRARVVDPTGAFVIYAGQYQPDALAFFERAEPPEFVAVTGKARTFQPEGSDRVFTSIRPESVNEVDAETRDRWVVDTASQTLERIAIFAKALDTDTRGADLQTALIDAGVQPGIAAGIPRAIEEYGTTRGYLAALQEMALDAVRLVADQVDEVQRTELAPDEGGDTDVDTGFAEDVALEEIEPETAASPPTEQGPDETADPSTAAGEPSEEATDLEDEDAEHPETPAAAEEAADQPETLEGEDEIGAESEATEAEGEEPEQPGTLDQEGKVGEQPEPLEPEDEVAEQPSEAETDEMYELSEEEREAVHENYEVDFESGADLAREEEEAESEQSPTTEEGPELEEEPEAIEEGSAAVEEEPSAVEQEPSAVEEEPSATEGESAAVEEEPTAEEEEAAGEEPPASESAAETSEEGEEGRAETLDEDELEDVVIETMKEIAGEDGIPRADLIEAVGSEHGVDASAIEEAIESALLGGRCFESGEDRLKPI